VSKVRRVNNLALVERTPRLGPEAADGAPGRSAHGSSPEDGATVFATSTS